jgi:hypothetical protein
LLYREAKGSGRFPQTPTFGDERLETEMLRRLLILGLVTLAALVQIHTAAAQSNSPPFPRLGAYLDAGAVNPGNVANIGKVQVLVISGYEGFTNLQQNVANAKAANPNMKVGAYTIVETQPNSGFPTQRNQMAAANWWLRVTYPSGALASEISSGAPNNVANLIQSLTSTNVPYPGGPTMAKNIRQWLAQYSNHYLGPGIAPNLDGMFIDNFFFQSRANQADWLETGSSQTDSSTAQAYRNAYADFVTQLRTVMGSQYMVWGNVADWLPGNSITGYSGVLNGGLYEDAIGQDTGGGGGLSGWAYMMGGYAMQMNAMVPLNGAGPYLIFEGAEHNYAVTDYQNMRYGLCSVLLDNGYYYFYNTGNDIPWFDEFNQTLGAAVAGPNNPNNGTYSSGGLTVWQNGVWRRDFANGIALVNPRGNGTRTVTLETTYKHFSGTQDPSLNNGQSVTSVTLNDRDGVILLRTTAQQQPVPDAPTLSVQ